MAVTKKPQVIIKLTTRMTAGANILGIKVQEQDLREEGDVPQQYEHGRDLEPRKRCVGPAIGHGYV